MGGGGYSGKTWRGYIDIERVNGDCEEGILQRGRTRERKRERGRKGGRERQM